LKRWGHHRVSVNAHRFGYRQLVALANSVVRAAQNDSGDLSRNGEVWLLERIAFVDPPAVVVDVGANRGQWATHARRSFPRSHLFLFEPNARSRSEMSPQLVDDPSVSVSPLALSDRVGTAVLYDEPGHSEMASLIARGQSSSATVATTTGDDWAHAAGIERIGFLKVDVEGHDLAVLRGFAGMLERKAIDLVQFEFTLWAAIARTWLADFHDLLAPLGYTIGKLYPARIDWAPYMPEHEFFSARANYVAVSPHAEAIRQSLGCPRSA
jgi:FkbM family methyltransferase